MKPGYKQTEVGVIPEEWEVQRVCEFSSVITGGTPRTEVREFWNGQFPWITPTDISEERDMWTSERMISESGLGTIRQLPANSVLVTCIASIGKNAILRSVGGCNQQINAVVPKKEFSPEFFYYSFDSSKQYLLSNAGMTATSIISKATFEQLKFPVPPASEQRAIAEALSDVDALLAALDRLIAKQRDLKQAAMQQLLTGQTRLPGFTGKWETKRLGDAAKIQRGASPRPIDSPIWFDENSPIGWVRISDVTRSGMFLQETTQRLSPLGVAHSRPVPTGSLIMSICATVGRPVITKIDVCIHDGFVVFDNPQADQLFLYYVLKWIESDWSKHGQTGSQMNLNTGLINGTPIHLPPLPEQTAIATVLSDMDGELAALEQRRDKTRALKQGMMQELLTGRTRLV